MSMLAEKRRKQKWSLNPQGKHWLTESNKFGLKILESMGWKEGKGLGKQQDGIIEPIRIAFKNDNKGLGLKENPSSMQQDRYSALLSSLNEDDVKTTKTVTSLEKKSQNSRTRVHYKKFTRGKDLSRYSNKDLANIFERKSIAIDVPVQEEVHIPDENNTVNKGSMLDYFSNKLPNGVKFEHCQTNSESDSDNEQPCFGFGFKGQGITNPAFNPASIPVKHSLDTILEEPEVLNESTESSKKTKKSKIKSTHQEDESCKYKKFKKSKSCVNSLQKAESNSKVIKTKKHKKGIDNPALHLNDSDESKKKDIKNNDNEKIKKRKKCIDIPTLNLDDSTDVPKIKVKKRKTKSGIDNPALNINLANDKEAIQCDLMLNVVDEPVLERKRKVLEIKRNDGCDNYGFDFNAQRIEENISSITRNIEMCQAEVENDINECKDVPFDEEVFVGEFNNSDGENQKQQDGVLLRYKYASFTKDPHWTVRNDQTVNWAKKSYKHLIRGDIAIAFRESNLHEIKGYGLGNRT